MAFKPIAASNQLILGDLKAILSIFKLQYGFSCKIQKRALESLKSIFVNSKRVRLYNLLSLT
jgi:hypothetical protein